MGRQKRQVPTGRLRLKVLSPFSKDKLYTVNLEYSWNGKVVRKSTDVRCRADDWNPKGNFGKGELRPSFGSEYKRMNAILQKRLSSMDARLSSYNEAHPNQITSDVINDILNDKPITRKDGGKDFADFALERLKSEYSRNKIGYSRFKNGVSALNVFSKFLASCSLGTYKDDGIYVSEITPQLLDKHIEWRRNIQHNSDATINHALTPMLQACKYARDLGLIDDVTNAAIQDMRIVIKPSIDEDNEEFDNRYLTKEQIKQLTEIYGTISEERRKEYIEMFLFSFHCCGLRVIDIMTLQWNSIDLEKKELKKVLVKTKSRHTIPLTDAAIKILQKWKERGRRKKFVFDLISDELNINDESALYKARNTVTKNIDQSLVVVGWQMKLPFSLTMHVVRHSFAVCALNDGVNMSVVSRLLGHSTTDVTEKVYAKYLPATLRDEVERLHYDYLPPNF